MLNEKKIIEELKKGNQDSFGLLYEKYSKGVYAVILNFVHDRDVADDLLQITFMKLFKNIKLYDRYKGTFYNFICAIGKNTALDYLKKVKRDDKVVDRKTTLDDGLMNLLDVKEDVANTIEVDELMNDLREAVCELAENQQIAIRLYCEREFSYRSAAKVMGISESSFKSILYRARQTLKDKISDKYPELFEEISTRKYVARMIVMVIVGLTALTGLVYATYMICNEIWSKKTFTLSELRTEVSHENSIISKDEAIERINFYLDVLGEEKANSDELKLIKDYQVYKVCWMVDRDDVIISIDSDKGELVSYSNFIGNEKLRNNSLEEIYKKMELPENYVLFKRENINGLEVIRYARKYGDIYNEHESVTFVLDNNKIRIVTFNNYEYEDNEVVISKEDALRIAEENNINVETIELSIEMVNDLKEDLVVEERIDTTEHEQWENIELFNKSIKIKKVWKVVGDEKIILVDVKTGEIIDNNK